MEIFIKILKDEKAWAVLKPGTLMNGFTPATYRTQDGLSYYKFRYVNLGRYFEIDIIEQPSYRGRNSGMHVAHWLTSGRGGKKICVSSGREPETIGAAKALSMGWAELTNEYIKTGKTIDRQVADNHRISQRENKPSLWEQLFG